MSLRYFKRRICNHISTKRIKSTFPSRELNSLLQLAIALLLGWCGILSAYTDSTMHQRESIDSVVVQLIKISKKNTFRIVTKQGKRYVGRIELIESGIKLIGKEYKRRRYGKVKVLSIPWTDIEELKIKPKENHSDIWIYIIGIPISFVISELVIIAF